MWHVCRAGEVHTGFWWGDLRERDNLEDLGVGGRTDLQKVDWWGEGLGWIHLAQDGDSWWAVVNAVMNVSGSINSGEFVDRPRTG